MAHLNYLQTDQSIQPRPRRPVALSLLPLLLSALLGAGCATKALHPATGIGDGKSSARTGDTPVCSSIFPFVSVLRSLLNL